MRIWFLCLVFLMAGPAGARADEPVGAIRWLLTGVPPKEILEGPLRGQGYGEQQAAFLARRLPQFRQSVETVSPARLWHELRGGRGICSIDIAKLPEREQWAVFTRRPITVPSYRLVVLREKLPEFAAYRDADGAIDLDRLGQSDRLKGLYVTSRFYMSRINAFLDEPGHAVRLEPVSVATRIFEMVASGRGDFAFVSVTEFNYFTALNEVAPPGGKKWPALAILPVKGGDEHVEGHIACSRDPLGQRMAAAVDQLLDDEATWAEFIAFERRWLDEDPLVR